LVYYVRELTHLILHMTEVFIQSTCDWLRANAGCSRSYLSGSVSDGARVAACGEFTTESVNTCRECYVANILDMVRCMLYNVISECFCL
jgi:hypothetical protein